MRNYVGGLFTIESGHGMRIPLGKESTREMAADAKRLYLCREFEKDLHCSPKKKKKKRAQREERVCGNAQLRVNP